MKKSSGYTLVELLFVMGIIALVVIMGIPSYSSYNDKKTISETAEVIKNEIRFQMNKSSSGVNKSWFGLLFVSKDGESLPLGQTSENYGAIEVTNPNDCLITASSLAIPQCANPNTTIKKTKNLPSGIYLNKITKIALDGTETIVPATTIRFSRSPDINQIVLAFPSDNSPSTSRVSLEFKRNSYTYMVVIDGGNICVNDQLGESTKCAGQLSGGPRAGRVFIVEKN